MVVLKCENLVETEKDKNSSSDSNLGSMSPSNLKETPILTLDQLPENLKIYPKSKCNRCKKYFAQMSLKSFKMCEHCRILQRQRSRRWQRRTKQKDGVCTRCGTELPSEINKFVLCQHCRDMLRSRKANRFLEGRCVHCSGPNDEEGHFKVCKRCREKDRLRRLALEQEGMCNRCSTRLPNDQKTHKVCLSCRLKKKKNEKSDRSNSISNERNIIRNIEVARLYSDDIKNKDMYSLQSDTSKLNQSEKNIHTHDQSSQITVKNNNFKEQSNPVVVNEKKETFGIIADDGDSVDHNNRDANILDGLGSEMSISSFPHGTGDDNNKKRSVEEINKIENYDAQEHQYKRKYGSGAFVNGYHLANSSRDLDADANDSYNHEQDDEEEEEVADNDDEADTDGDNVNDNGEVDTDLSRYEQHILMSNSSKSIDENILLAGGFNIHHDHSQLNQQLKQLSQFTAHTSNVGGGIDGIDKYDNDSVLVDLDSLGVIGMEYEIDDVVDEGNVHGRGSNAQDEEEKETMLRHVRAVQAGLISNTTEPSDAEIAAAVEAVAVAAAAAHSKSDANESEDE